MGSKWVLNRNPPKRGQGPILWRFTTRSQPLHSPTLVIHMLGGFQPSNRSSETFCVLQNGGANGPEMATNKCQLYSVYNIMLHRSDAWRIFTLIILETSSIKSSALWVMGAEGLSLGSSGRDGSSWVALGWVVEVPSCHPQFLVIFGTLNHPFWSILECWKHIYIYISVIVSIWEGEKNT